ncbi:MAG TPA: twin-arginine translocase TatA/TatE family subunit [Blastocatellia bacterium]|nr:twin-arginine translocase TatA/TatE family subunit [Blastocatellia bacterium]
MIQCELTNIPVNVLMMTLASRDWSPGGWELIIILIIVLVLFGAKNLPAMARGMGESIRNFMAAMPKSGMPHQQRQQRADSGLWWFLGPALLALAITLPVLSSSIFSGEQKTVLMAVLLCWIGVAYWTFGRRSRKGGDQ